MKKGLLYLAAMSALAFTSCDMEEIPQSEASKEAVFSSETGLEMYANSFYNVFPSTPVIYTDSYYIAKNDVVRYFLDGAYSAEESGGWSWSALRNINYFIVNCTNENVSESVRNNYIGIAKFFRAYFYFDMMKRFGDLPWIDTPLDVNDESLYAGRDDRTLIVEKIKEDLDFAINNITKRRDTSCSTITSAVAAALKSRVCLWEGTFRKYHTEYNLQSSADEWLKEAVSASEYVMESGYSIYTGAGVESSYRSLFTAVTPISEEVLYAATFSGTLSVVHSGTRSFNTVTLGLCPSLTRSLVNTYLMLDGTSFTDKADYKTTSFVDECKNRDYRLSQTVRTPGFTRTSNGATVETAPDYAIALTGYHTIKFSLDDTKYDSQDICDNNVIVFRYAETLLNYAEAKAELGTLTDADWAKTIGTLRARAGITGGLTSKPTVVDSYMKQRFFPNVTDASLMEIRRERAVELCFEGFSWSDICRWKVGELVTNVWDGIYIPEFDVPYDMNGDGTLDVCFTQNLSTDNRVSGVYYLYVGEKLANGSDNNAQLDTDGHTLLYMKSNVRTWNDKLYFYPIPATDLVLNPNLGQNPGW
jgi:hypothetical protein